MQLCLLQPPTAADYDDFLDFSYDDIFFHRRFRSLIDDDNDDDRAFKRGCHYDVTAAM